MSTNYRRGRERSKRRGRRGGPRPGSATRQGRRRRVGRSDDSTALPGVGEPVTLSATRSELLAMMRDSLHTFAVEMGVLVACQLLEEDVAELCGRPYERRASRGGYRHGAQSGYVVLAGQKIAIDRPRVRSTEAAGGSSGGEGEVALPTYAQLQEEDAMPESVLRRMAAGVSCRDYEGVIDLACAGFGVAKSSVSRQFVRATASQLEQFVARRFDGVRFAAIFVDGLDFAGETMVCALGLASNGTKHVLGLRQGATENAAVVKALLSELRDRGVVTDQATLFVLDGAKALRSGVKQVWGRCAIIQRCQVHKKRNVRAHLPKKHWQELDRRLGRAYAQSDYDEAVRQLKATVRWLKPIQPDAASSLAEGLEETVTVARLKVGKTLRETLTTTNPIESAFDTARAVTGRVKRWREGDMRRRWCACGLLRAEQGFHRVKGYRDLTKLTKALDALVAERARLDEQDKAA